MTYRPMAGQWPDVVSSSGAARRTADSGWSWWAVALPDLEVSGRARASTAIAVGCDAPPALGQVASTSSSAPSPLSMKAGDKAVTATGPLEHRLHQVPLLIGQSLGYGMARTVTRGPIGAIGTHLARAKCAQSAP